MARRSSQKPSPAVVLLILLLAAAVLLPGCRKPEDAAPKTEIAHGISSEEVLIGSSLALAGHAGYLGTQILHGALAYINHVNTEGGVHGRKIRLLAYDDGYDPPRCVYNTQRLIVENQVFALFGYVGTPTTVKVLPLIEEARIPLVGMFTGAHDLREPPRRYVINVRASYYQETGAAVHHLVQTLGLQDIGVFYQYDTYGFDGLRGTELALKTFGKVPVATATYIRGTLEVDEGLEKIMAAGAQAVVMIGTYEPCARFITLAHANGYAPVFCNVSFVGADELARRLGPLAEGIIVTQVVPPPELPTADPRLWGLAQYAALLKRYYPEDRPNFVSLEGFINARVLIEGLRRAGRDLDRETFIDAIESIRDYDLGIDNTLSFSPTNHQGLERVYFTHFREGRFVTLER